MIFFSKLCNWYFKRNALPYWCILILDCLIIYLTSIGIYFLFHGNEVLIQNFRLLSRTVVACILITVIWFRIFHTYSGILRFSSFIDLRCVGCAMGCGFIVITILKLSFHFDGWLLTLRFRELISICIISTFTMWVVRVLIKALYDVYFDTSRSRRTFIYGAGGGSIGLAKNINNEKPTRFRLKGFVSQNQTVTEHMLMGKKVYPINDKLQKILKDKRIRAFIVPPDQNNQFRNDSKLQDVLVNAGLHIYMLLPAEEMEHNNAAPPQLRKVDVEDLLPREEIKVNLDYIEKMLCGKNIMITGSAGSIGSEIVRQIAAFNPAKLILIDQAETPQHDIRLMMKKRWPQIETETVVASICAKKHMEGIFKKFQPDYVFHAAAYKHVPMMEDNPGESVHNNIFGTKLIADLSVKYGVKKFVMISTDKAVNPTNVMGCSKRICEIYVQSLDKAIKNGEINGVTQFVTTRFGNVLGSNGSVIPLFKEQIKAGGPITVTDPNIIRYFMLIPEACKLVLEAGTNGCGGEIFVFDMGAPVKISDLAKRMIFLSGAKNVKIVYTGLRDGEKLYEEVLNEKETTKETSLSKIRIATVREYDYNEACKQLDELFNICESYDDMAIVKQMKIIVPEYISKNSKYEVLDA